VILFNIFEFLAGCVLATCKCSNGCCN
jgi:hypothetical protein